METDYQKYDREREERRQRMHDLERAKRLAAKPIFQKGEEVWRFRSGYTSSIWERAIVAHATKAEVTLNHQYGSSHHYRPSDAVWTTTNRNSSIYKLDDPYALARIEENKEWALAREERQHPLLPINQTAASIVEEIEVTACARIESQAAFAWQMVGGVEIRFGNASAATVTFATTAQIEKLINDLQAAKDLIARARMPESNPLPAEKNYRGFAYNERGEKIAVTVPEN